MSRRRVFVSCMLVLLAAAGVMQLLTGNASDKNWLLEAAHRWVLGGRLYTDIFEVNPPLIVWLYAVPEWLSPHLKLSDATLLAVLGLAACGLCVLVSEILIRHHPGFAGDARRQSDFALLLALVLIFCTAPMYFADREHLFFVLTLPYLIRFCPGLARREFPAGLRIAIALMAAVGFCIKPHTAVVFAVLQLLYIARERSFAILWSLENAIIYLACGLYIGFILLFLPAYAHIVLPMALETYGAYSRRLNGLYSIILFLVITGITFADFRPKYKTPYRPDVYYFLGICGAYLMYGLINNGWAYTYIPLLSMARLLAGWVLFEFLWLKQDAEGKGEPSRPFRFGIISTGAGLTLNAAFYLFCLFAYLTPVLVPPDCEKSLACRGTVLFFKEARAQKASSFGTMSLEFSKWPELARETGERWATRFNHLWMLPQFVISGEPFREKHGWIIDYVGKAYAEDLDTGKPDIVYVDTSPSPMKGRGPIDLPGFFAGVPEFDEAWSHYRRTDVIDACVKAPEDKPDAPSLKADCRFDLYTRIPSP